MDIQAKMNAQFRNLQSGLFSIPADDDIAEDLTAFQQAGGDILAWADLFLPDRFLPESVSRAVQNALSQGIGTHTDMPIGSPALREAIARQISKRTGLEIDAQRNILVTPGSDSGLFYAMMPFIAEGDEVLVPDPSYPNNFQNPALLGGKAVPVPLYAEDNWQPRVEEFEKRLTPRTKMVLLTHPNNPTSTVFRRENLEALCAFIVKHDLVLICDQAFEDHVFDGIEYVSPCTLPGMWERTITVCSLSKGYGLSGFRIAYLYANDHIMDVLYAACANILGTPNTLASVGALAALEDDTILPAYSALLECRRRLAYDLLSGIPGTHMQLSESGFVCWLDVHRLGTSEEVTQYLMTNARILVSPGSSYGGQGEGFLRIVTGCFVHEQDAVLRFERIRDALTRLAQAKGIA